MLNSLRRCCLCFGLDGDGRVKPGQIAHLDHDRTNNAPDNLIFLCLNHHAEYDAKSPQAKGFTIEEVRGYQDRLRHAEEAGVLPASATPASYERSVVQIAGANSVQAGRDAHIGQVNIRVIKARRDLVMPGTVAAEPILHNYLEYLVGRYHKLKEWDCEKAGQKMNYAIVRQAYKSHMKCDVRHTPKEHFTEAVAFLQDRIRRTRLGRIQGSKGNKLYETFEE